MVTFSLQKVIILIGKDSIPYHMYNCAATCLVALGDALERHPAEGAGLVDVELVRVVLRPELLLVVSVVVGQRLPLRSHPAQSLRAGGSGTENTRLQSRCQQAYFDLKFKSTISFERSPSIRRGPLGLT